MLAPGSGVVLTGSRRPRDTTLKAAQRSRGKCVRSPRRRALGRISLSTGSSTWRREGVSGSGTAVKTETETDLLTRSPVRKCVSTPRAQLNVTYQSKEQEWQQQLIFFSMSEWRESALAMTRDGILTRSTNSATLSVTAAVWETRTGQPFI